MNILVPMAGAGSRFTEKGYTLHKPVIPVTSRRLGRKLPMVVNAVFDLPSVQCATGRGLSFVVRDFHVSEGVCDIIRDHCPAASFVTVDRLTEGQASTCLLARETINNDEALLIAACDNGMDIDQAGFECATLNADAVIFTFRHNEAVVSRPQAYGWVLTEGTDAVGVSIKKPISDTPMDDHAIVGTFWFRRGCDFVAAAEQMIAANDRINGEFYVDQVFKHMLCDGLKVVVFEIDRYICWGTPEDYEIYEDTISYWKAFLDGEKIR